MGRLRIDYTLYSPEYVTSWDSNGSTQKGHGECWDCPTFRSAKRKAKELGIGSKVIRNFNQPDKPGKPGEWWQTDFCWVWDGFRFKKTMAAVENKWIISDTWKRAATLALYYGEKG